MVTETNLSSNDVGTQLAHLYQLAKISGQNSWLANKK